MKNKIEMRSTLIIVIMVGFFLAFTAFSVTAKPETLNNTKFIQMATGASNLSYTSEISRNWTRDYDGFTLSSEINVLTIFDDTSGVVRTKEKELSAFGNNSLQNSLDDELSLFVPNAFTPDGNERNNVFIPVFRENAMIDYYLLQIFNRWGELVFESMDPNNGWDGTTMRGGMAQVGMYIWSLTYSESNEKIMNASKKQIRGQVNLLR